MCGVAFATAGTAAPPQIAGDCHVNECDGAGNVTSVVDDTDVPVDGNDCTADACSGGVPSNPNLPVGTACSQNGGTTCDGSGSCLAVVSVVRVGDGTGGLSSAAAPVFVEQHLLSGALLASPIALPTASSGANQALTTSGTSTSEGALFRSTDGHYVTLAGYAAAPGTASVAATTAAATNRIVGRIDASGTVDTSTRINNGFSGSNVRGAASVDGTAFWVSGTAGSGAAGIFYVPLGATAGTQLITTPNNTRVAGIFGGQLYGSAASGTFVNVFTVGSGLPTTSGQTATSLPGMPTAAGPSPYGFVFFDRNPGVPGLDALYVADDRAVASGGGIQKWTFDGTTWTLASTFNSGLATGTRGLTGFVTGANVTLVATTAEASQNKLVVVVDDGSASPAAAVVATAGANTVFRGVALSPQ
jgi:hypothetical protein